MRKTQPIVDLLPEDLYVLDIETLGKTPGRSTVACIGVKRYERTGRTPLTLAGTFYKPREYRCFGPDPLPASVGLEQEVRFGEGALRALERFLGEVPGPIVGHNLFEFDYRCLAGLIDLRGIIEKSVDTLYFLWRRSGKDLLGLSLDHLTFGKPFRSSTIPRQWKEGRYRDVISYNEHDCDLTAGLWWSLIFDRTVRIEREHYTSTFVSVSLEDIEELTGHAPPLSFASWKDLMETSTICG